MCEEEIIPKDVSQRDISISSDIKTSIEEQQSQKDEKEKATVEALAFARRPDLLKCLIQEKDRFIVGEDANFLLLFHICASRIFNDPLGAVVTGSSSVGKSHMLNRALRYFPDVRRYTRITSKSLDRTEEDMKHKILVIEELGGLQAQSTLRVMISEGQLKLLTTDRDENNRITTREISTTGVPVFLTTTANYQIDKQTQNRLLVISLDETKKQTRRILEFQAKQFAKKTGADIEPNPLIKAYLDILENTWEVAIPFAEELAGAFPVDTVTARRDLKKLFKIIGSSAYLYQFQRSKVQDQNNKLRCFILADPVDFRYAIDIAGESLEQTFAGIQRRAMEALEVFRKRTSLTSRQLADELKISQRRARQIANALVNAGYLQRDDSEKTHVFILSVNTDLQLTELRESLKDWNADKLQRWLQATGLSMKEEAPQPQYIEPFTRKISVSASSSNEEHQAISETASKHQAESEIASSPSVTHEAETETLQKKSEETVPKTDQEKLEVKLRRNLPPFFSYDVLIKECMKTGRSEQDCMLLCASWNAEGKLREFADDQGWQWLPKWTQ